MKIKHIFSDMDRTLLNNKGATNVKLIKETHIPFILVSARAPFEMAATVDGCISLK